MKNKMSKWRVVKTCKDCGFVLFDKYNTYDCCPACGFSKNDGHTISWLPIKYKTVRLLMIKKYPWSSWKLTNKILEERKIDES